MVGQKELTPGTDGRSGTQQHLYTQVIRQVNEKVCVTPAAATGPGPGEGGGAVLQAVVLNRTLPSPSVVIQAFSLRSAPAARPQQGSVLFA